MQSWEALSVPVEQGVYKLWFKIAVAAAVATIVFGVWFFAYREVASSLAPRNEDWAKNDVAPGKNGATITLVSGEVIQLSDAKKGVVIGNGKISYIDGAEIASQARNDGQGGEGQGGHPSLRGTKQSPVEMTAATAKGQTYEFTLPDGTHVWLNADSKISFPSQFSGKERKILLEGEAYFAVVHNAKQPFRVESKGQIVEDIGTEFNINAYPDESSIKTTLVEGIAKVNTVILKPNQQATLSGSSLKVATVNPELAISWKNGLFSYRKASLEEVMRQVARWYDVEVIYEQPELRQKQLTGSVSRYDKVSGILGVIEDTGTASFRIEGRKIYVRKQ